MKVIKKDGTVEDYNEQKIINACAKSAGRSVVTLSPDDYLMICNKVFSEIQAQNFDKDAVPVKFIHNIVEKTLLELYPEVGFQYQQYRNYKNDFVHMLDEVYSESQKIMYIGDKENSNTDSALVSTKRSLVFNQLNKKLYQKFFMTTEELQACRDGYIYVHDMSARRDTMNCCLFDVQKVLSGGFEMGNVWYNEPTSLDTAFDVIGDIVLSAASQQYGGFTLPEIDKVLEPYAVKSFEKYCNEYITTMMKYGHVSYFDRDNVSFYAKQKVKRDIEQGYQGWEYKFNTVASSRGDYPFITITFGLETSDFGRMISKTILEVHRKGQGKANNKKPVLFPKLVFLYNENLHGSGKPLEDVFEAGVRCSARTMYPDWLSLTGEGYVASMYKKYGKIVSPMGCVDGKEIITYSLNNKLYVESFERMWNRLSDNFEIKQQEEGSIHLYMDLEHVRIWDTKTGFTKVKRIVCNLSDIWMDIHLSEGRRLLCTADHPFTTVAGDTKRADELCTEDSIAINSAQYCSERIKFNCDKAWLLGFMLCDGCYQNSRISASIAQNGENEIEEKFHATFSKYFGLITKTVVQSRGEKGYYKDLVVKADSFGNLQRVINYLTNKFEGINKADRHIPNEVFEWDYDSKLAFLAGMIDADGYINSTSHGGSVVQIGSTNKELALQQMALAQALGMPAKIYHNHNNRKKPNAIRYRVEFFPVSELISYIVCKKKTKNYIATLSSHFQKESKVIKTTKISRVAYSYDVMTESEHFEVSGIYSHNCRAFLSPWYERGGMNPADDKDTPVFVGRFNIGAVSLHLPMILAKAKQENKDFYEVLDYYLNLIRQLHIRTYAYLGEMRASTNPLAYCEGGFLGGNLKLSDKIKPLLKSATASFGITALNEMQMLYNGKSLVEDGQFALEVMEHINSKINEYKEEDGNLYAIYGTPAENLCGLQVKQFRNKYGIIEGVSDREYVSNSFHCHVTEEITPIEKQDKEGRFWNLCNGGKIQYVKYPIDYNMEAIKTLIRRAMGKGFYEGVNLSLAYCDDCGHQELEMDVCPKCGSHNLTKIDRMNGYLSYSRVHGDTRLNEAKMAEIAERKSM